MTKEVKIGLIGIAALAMLIFGINYLKGINMFQSANYYYVEYTNINGLAGSSPVFANGYKVGTVRNINYNYAKPGHVTVEVEVDKEMRIPKGSAGEGPVSADQHREPGQPLAGRCGRHGPDAGRGRERGPHQQGAGHPAAGQRPALPHRRGAPASAASPGHHQGRNGQRSGHHEADPARLSPPENG